MLNDEIMCGASPAPANMVATVIVPHPNCRWVRSTLDTARAMLLHTGWAAVMLIYRQ